MEDKQIVELYWARSEAALSETEKKYGKYCFAVARHILNSREDCEECVNDTYLKAWNSMPPRRPSMLRTFLGKITRNLSLDRYEKNTAKKRGRGEVFLALHELAECIPDKDDTEAVVDNLVLTELFNRFLSSLSEENRKIFVQRYWYLCSVREIAMQLGLGESKVKVSLLRLRERLKAFLEEEGVSI